jgi:hypothetical protein
VLGPIPSREGHMVPGTMVSRDSCSCVNGTLPLGEEAGAQAELNS